MDRLWVKGRGEAEGLRCFLSGSGDNYSSVCEKFGKKAGERSGGRRTLADTNTEELGRVTRR